MNGYKNKQIVNFRMLKGFFMDSLVKFIIASSSVL